MKILMKAMINSRNENMPIMLNVLSLKEKIDKGMPLKISDNPRYVLDKDGDYIPEYELKYGEGNCQVNLDKKSK